MFARAEEPRPADLWRLVAKSRLIVIGTPLPDPATLASARQAYVNIPVEQVTALKGHAPSQLVVIHWTGKVPHAPSNDEALAARGRASVFFLVGFDAGRGEQFYFAQDKASLHLADAEFTAATRREISWQDDYLRHWKADSRAPHTREVRSIINRIAALRSSGLGRKEAGRAQDAAFHRLEALGLDAVPAIIAQMDDRRRLAVQAISLVNTATDAFESHRLYGPELIVDALSAILNQITGESFSSIFNGGSEADRAHDVNGWRIYAKRGLSDA